ncbi:hypothetical protein Bbelb_195940 [Branchiostoma belcheri]|nr:hypothetical protein Bbelb_195940 [Branchiostoma belcheri]
MGAYKYTTHQVGPIGMGHQRWICNSILQPRILEKARKNEIAIRLPKISSSEDSEYSIPAPATTAPCNTPEVLHMPPASVLTEQTSNSSIDDTTNMIQHLHLQQLLPATHLRSASSHLFQVLHMPPASVLKE